MFDNVGNILTVQDNIGSGGLTTYTYDDLNRLMSATATLANSYSRSWTYAPIGNILTRDDGGGALTYEYNNPATQPHAVKNISSNYFCYDLNGNMERRNSNSGCTSGDVLSYDVENRMTSMTTGSGTTMFGYNGDGTRVSRTTSAGTTYYVGNHYEIFKPTAGTTTFNKYYYFGTNRIAARIGSTTPSNGDLFYMQGDHLGSSSLVMTSGGALNTRQTYYPYGAKRFADGNPLPNGMDYTFTGQKSDDSTGLMFYNARYYDTTLGRFTQADTIVPNPINPQSLNRYSYVGNNPVNLIDPSGHTDCAPEDTGCWEKRYFEAHGQCFSERRGDYSRACTPEFADAGILDEVLGEQGGRDIVQKADPVKVLLLVLAAGLQGMGTNLPNMLILGIQGGGTVGTGYGSVYAQTVFDFKHNQIADFAGGAYFLGLGYGVGGGIHIGFGWCGINCYNVTAYKDWFNAVGGSAGIGPLGFGGEYQTSKPCIEHCSQLPFASSDASIIQTMTFSAAVGAGLAEVHYANSWAGMLGAPLASGSNDNVMAASTFSKVAQMTNGNFGLASAFAAYAFTVTYEEPR